MKKMLLVAAATILALAASSVIAAPTVAIDGGRTSVELSSEFAGALDALGVEAGIIDPAGVRRDRIAFPIPAGALDLATLRGEILHTGGLTLSAGDIVVELENFIIDTQDSPVLTGLVTVNDDFVARLPLFDLELTSAPGIFNLFFFKTIVVRDVDLTLTQAAADALNGVFGIDDLAGGFPIGVARVIARADRGDFDLDAVDPEMIEFQGFDEDGDDIRRVNRIGR